MMTKEELIDGIIKRLVRLGYVNLEKLEIMHSTSCACACNQENQDKERDPGAPPSCTD